MSLSITASLVEKTSTSEIGNKAMQLGRLARRGYVVPDGIVVATRGYEFFLERNGLVAMVREFADASLKATPRELVAMFADLQRLFGAAVMPAEIEVEVQAWLERSPATFFAVRSSATNEDSCEASFAGQYDSYLNVENNSISKQIACCFASLFNPRAALYRRRHGFTSPGAMAVIVQEMAASDHAGVVFTRAPRRSDQLLIECAPGLADRVVSGNVSPNRYFVDRQTLQVTESVEPHVYDCASVALIAEKALAIESDLGGPLDIEFCVQSGGIHILQARPIPASIRNHS